MRDETNLTVPVAALTAFIAEVFEAYGMPQDDARLVGKMMVEADLHGSNAHGVFRLKRYVDRLKAGGFNLRPNIHVDKRKGGLARVNGDDAMGHLVVKTCVDEAISLARTHGVSWVGCHHSNHAGAAGVWAMQPVAEDMICIYTAVGSANHMAPWGGTELLLSTNPIAIGVPGGKGGPVLLDMATTNAAYGKIKMAAAQGRSIPEGWMIDKEGNALTDPNKAAGGSLLPIGRGQGLWAGADDRAAGRDAERCRDGPTGRRFQFRRHQFHQHRPVGSGHRPECHRRCGIHQGRSRSHPRGIGRLGATSRI